MTNGNHKLAAVDQIGQQDGELDCAMKRCSDQGAKISTRSCESGFLYENHHAKNADCAQL